MTDLKQRILAAAKNDLELIETQLTTNLSPHLELVGKVAGHLLFAGGKRLRPLLMVLAARICGSRDPELFRYAIIFEYLHAATLLHDDFVDGSGLRRGQPAAHTLWDPPTAVLAGDFLLARSLSIAAATGIPALIDVMANITENMSQGEIEQLHRKGDLDITEQEYYTVIERKTAVLFKGACRAGAMIAGADGEPQKALAAYGYHLGMAFQIADDLLDYTQDSSAMGKMPGADLREGKLTLPVIRALAKAGSDDYRRMCNIIARPDFSDDDFRQIVQYMHSYGGIEYARAKAAGHVAKAEKSLEIFKQSATMETMKDIARYALVRKN